MTEQQWLKCAHPEPLLKFLRGTASDRKLRLLAVACCRRISHLLPDERSANALITVEQAADQLIAKANLKYCRDVYRKTPPTPAEDWGIAWHASTAVQSAIQPRAWNGARDSASKAADAISEMTIQGQDRVALTVRREKVAARRTEEVKQAAFLRCIFGNPFRPITLDPAWQTANVVGLAQSIYEERAFDRLPILADALEDAGCDNADVLNHCRQPGDHVRGCWALDLVLGKQ